MTTAPSKPTRIRRWWPILATVLIVALAALWFPLKSRSQLLGRTAVAFETVLTLFASDHGRLPHGIDELQEKGYLKWASHQVGDQIWQGYDVVDERRPTRGLWRLESITVDWTYTPDRATLQGGRLVDKASGKQVFIIRTDAMYNPFERSWCADASRKIHLALAQQTGKEEVTP